MVVITDLFPKLETVKILLRPLSKKHRFRTWFHSRHVKEFQALMKAPWEHYCHVFSHSQGG